MGSKYGQLRKEGRILKVLAKISRNNFMVDSPTELGLDYDDMIT